MRGDSKAAAIIGVVAAFCWAIHEGHYVAACFIFFLALYVVDD